MNLTNLGLGSIFAALLYLIFRPIARDWQARRRYQRYRAAVLANGWFDPEINPDASGRSSQSLPGNSGST